MRPPNTTEMVVMENRQAVKSVRRTFNACTVSRVVAILQTPHTFDELVATMRIPELALGAFSQLMDDLGHKGTVFVDDKLRFVSNIKVREQNVLAGLQASRRWLKRQRKGRRHG